MTFEAVRQDITHAFRRLRREPGFSLIAILTRLNQCLGHAVQRSRRGFAPAAAVAGRRRRRPDRRAQSWRPRPDPLDCDERHL